MAKRIRYCSDPDCSRPSRCRGLCTRHHWRAQRDGTLPPVRKPTADERFLAMVDPIGPILRPEMGRCAVWTGALADTGYGIFGVTAKRLIGAHRHAWTLAAGSIPTGLFVLHACDHRACVRTDGAGEYVVRGISHPRQGHLWLGTSRDNMQDMADKGRSGGQQVTHCPANHEYTKESTYVDPVGHRYCRICRSPLGIDVIAKRATVRPMLTATDIPVIRAAYATGGISQAALGTQYCVTQSAISSIVLRKTWVHVT